jgi:hypothetical protein
MAQQLPMSPSKVPVAGTQSLRLVPLLGVPKRDPSRNREIGSLVAANNLKNATSNQKTLSLVVEVFKKRCK